MIRAASYCRVSTDREDQANSFASQQRYFREYIRNRPGWELYQIYADEGITGTSTKKRIQFNRMIADAYEGRFQMILTKEVSRFSRNILDTIAYTRELRSIGIGVIFVNDRINTLEPEAEMLLSFLASLAQEESRRTSSRVVWGQARQMERGVVFGRSLLGYDVKDGAMTVNPQGAETVRLIFHKYALEQAGTADIARFLTENGYRTHRGHREWKPNTINKILHNEKYAGDLIQKKTYTPDYLTHEKRPNKGEIPKIIIPNHHEPIISRELWDMAQARLQQNHKHNAASAGHSGRYLFSGKIICAVCGKPFVGRYKYRKDGSKVRRWRCSTEQCSVGRQVRDDDAMQMLKTAIGSLPMDRSAVIRNITALVLDAIRAGEQGIQEDLRRLPLEAERLHQKKEAVMDSYFSGEISKEEMQSMKQKYDGQLEALQLRIQSANCRHLPESDALIGSEVAAMLLGESDSEVFCKQLLDRLTVYADRHLELRLKHLPQVFHFT